MSLQFNLSESNATVLAQVESDPGAVRLDADLYHVDDVHGGTESLSGSGNLNYLALQTRPPNDALPTNDYGQRDASVFFEHAPTSQSNRMAISPLDAAQGRTYQSDNLLGLAENGHTLQSSLPVALSANPIGNPALSSFSSLAQAGLENGQMVSNAVASSSNANSSLLDTVLGGGNGLPGISGINGNDGTNGNNGENGGHCDGGGHCEGGGESHCGGEPGLTINLPSPVINIDAGCVLDPVEKIIGGVESGLHGNGDALILTPNIEALNVPLVNGTISVPLTPLDPVLGQGNIIVHPTLGLLDTGSISNTGLDSVYHNTTLTSVDLPDVTSGDGSGLLPGGSEAGGSGCCDPLANTLGTIETVAHDTAGIIDNLPGNLSAAGSDLVGTATTAVATLPVTVTEGLDTASHGTMPVIDSVLSTATGDAGQTLQTDANHADSLIDNLPGNLSTTGSDLVGTAAAVTASLPVTVTEAVDTASHGTMPVIDSVLSTAAGDAGQTLQTVANHADSLTLDLNAGVHAVDLASADTGIGATLSPGSVDVNTMSGADLLHGAASTATVVTAAVDPGESLLQDLSHSLLSLPTGDGLSGTATATSSIPSVADTGSTSLIGTEGVAHADTASWPTAALSAGAPAASTNGSSVLPDPVGHVSEGLGSVIDHSHAAIHHTAGLLG